MKSPLFQDLFELSLDIVQVAGVREDDVYLQPLGQSACYLHQREVRVVGEVRGAGGTVVLSSRRAFHLCPGGDGLCIDSSSLRCTHPEVLLVVGLWRVGRGWGVGLGFAPLPSTR